MLVCSVCLFVVKGPNRFVVAMSRWGPQLEQATYKNRQRLYLSEQASLLVSVCLPLLCEAKSLIPWQWSVLCGFTFPIPLFSFSPVPLRRESVFLTARLSLVNPSHYFVLF
jgi:hypothetical protein